MIDFKKLTNDDIKQIIKDIKDGKIETNFSKEMIKELYKELRSRGKLLSDNTRKYIKIGAIITVLIVSLICIGIGIINRAEAEETTICNSNKCEARLERLKECSGYTNNEEEKILCATYLTVSEAKREITPQDKEVIKEEIRNLNELTKPKDELSLDRLAKAVAIAETSNCTKGYGVTHNNCHGIKHGNTVPCPGVPKGAMCKFTTTEESFEAFKIIWSKWYKTYPTYELAHRWTGGDRVNNWLNIISYNY